MNGVDLHPEELLDRVRRGQATPSERERVHAHLQSCEACRFEHVLLAQSTRDAAPHPGDAARARGIEQAAVAALRARGLLTRGRPARRARRVGGLLAAALVSSLATAAAAAVLTQPAWLTRMIAPAPSAAPPPVRAHAASATRAHKPAVPVVAPAVAAPVADPMPAPAAEPTRAAVKARAVTRSAAEIFAAANAARREREAGSAARLYRELLHAHPRSQEAPVAQIALGRLLLDRLGDARGALREFDAYLADPQQSTLREDALIGRALSLRRLGRAPDEQAAWTALLAAFPASAYAEHAQARLHELR